MIAFGDTKPVVLKQRKGIAPSRGQVALWEGARMTMRDSIDLTAQSLQAYGALYRHWVIAFSGGKDSTTVATVIPHLIESGEVEAPESITVMYGDTRQEIPPLHIAAMQTLEALKARGVRVQVVMAEMDDRYFVYMLGRGVPPPNNQTLRWCTEKLKINPMVKAQWDLAWDLNGPRTLAMALAAHWGLWAVAWGLLRGHERFLVLTGVRVGESAARDQRIALSCSKNGSECGQGWYQHSTPGSIADTLSPILHWRVCHVWDWLMFEAPAVAKSAALVAEVYGGEEAAEKNARTGCIGCPLAEEDTALDHVISLPEWRYLAPLKGLRPLYRELRRFRWRLQKDGERNKDGKLSSNPNRKGPLTMDARRMGLAQVVGIQRAVNRGARAAGRPRLSLISWPEFKRIRELQRLNTWPDRWDGTEARGDVLIAQTLGEGIRQELLLTLEER